MVGTVCRVHFVIPITTLALLWFLFMIVHWLRMESTLKKRLISLPFLILQIWPQVQICKLLKMGLYDKHPQWRQRKDSMEREVSSVGKNWLNIFNNLRAFQFCNVSEPFLESIPQIHILLIIYVQDGIIFLEGSVEDRLAHFSHFSREREMVLRDISREKFGREKLREKLTIFG